MLYRSVICCTHSRCAYVMVVYCGCWENTNLVTDVDDETITRDGVRMLNRLSLLMMPNELVVILDWRWRFTSVCVNTGIRSA